MFAQLKTPFLALALCAALAPASRADGFGISYSNNTGHGAFSVGYSTGPFWAPSYPSYPSYRVRRPARWVPGHYETVRERVWIPARYERVWIEPVYTWRRDSCGRAYQVCAEQGRYQFVKQPGYYDHRDGRVWVEGFWRP